MASSAVAGGKQDDSWASVMSRALVLMGLRTDQELRATSTAVPIAPPEAQGLFVVSSECGTGPIMPADLAHKTASDCWARCGAGDRRGGAHLQTALIRRLTWGDSLGHIEQIGRWPSWQAGQPDGGELAVKVAKTAIFRDIGEVAT